MLSVSFFLFLLDYFGLFLFYIHGIIHVIILRLHVSRNPKFARNPKPRTRKSPKSGSPKPSYTHQVFF